MSSSDLVPTSKSFQPMLRVGGVQMTSGGSVAESLERAAKGLAKAVEQGATLVVLPENFATLGTGASADIAADEAHGTLPQVHAWAAQQACQHAVHLVAGTVPVQDPTTGKSHARSRVYRPDGSVLCHYDKIHLFDAQVGDSQGRYAESDHYLAGQDVVTFQLPGIDGAPVTVGMSVCYDLRFPELYLALRNAGADLILVPSAFTHRTGQAHWSLLLRARAVEQGCYVFGVNQCGWHDSLRRTWGHSQLIDPWGETVAILAGEPDALVGDLSRERLQKIRSQMPVHEHHRL